MTRLTRRLLEIVEVNSNPEDYASIIARNLAPTFNVSSVAMTAVKRKLNERSPKPTELMAKLDAMRESDDFDAADLDKFVCLLSKILDDKALVVMLGRAISPLKTSASSRRTQAAAALAKTREDRESTLAGRAASKLPGAAGAGATKPSMKPALSPGIATALGGAAPASRDRGEGAGKMQGSPSVSTGGGRLEVAEKSPGRDRFADARNKITEPPSKSPTYGAPALQDKAMVSIPDWVTKRAYLSGCQYLQPLSKRAQVTPVTVKQAESLPLGSYPSAVQEILIVEDLLYCMMGLDGRYMHFESLSAGEGDSDEGLAVKMEKSFDISLADLAIRITPLGVYYVRIMRFIDDQTQFSKGLVNHAFAAAVRRLLREYLVLLAQLENQYRDGGLSLQRLWFYVQPSVRIMEVLDRVTREANRNYATGGALLNLIHERGIKHGGDRLARELFFHLMQQASLPYFEMLEHWIFTGVIKDPYGEFLIEERADMKKEILNENVYDNYWVQRYTVRESQKPAFLNKVADKILKAGKYLNVIRECGRTFLNPHKAKISFTHHEHEYIEKIEKAYAYASQKLLDMFLVEEQLLARLRSIKHYFLLDQGDFINHFMDIADSELAKNVHDISPTKLANLLELALRTSIANYDPFKDDLMCDLEPYTLVKHIMGIVGVSDSKGSDPAPASGSAVATSPAARASNASQAYGNLTGLDLFTLSYSVRWPLSLIVPKKVLVKYQLIFRHLFHCKHVQRQLCKTWLNHQSTKAWNMRRSFVQSYALQQQMLHFLNNIQHYMMNEVLEPRWHSMELKIRKVSSVDEVLQHHNEFLDACFKECMLRNPRLLKILTKLMSTCITFSKHIDKVYKDFLPEDQFGTERGKSKKPEARFEQTQERFKNGTEHAKKVVDSKGFQGTITKLEKTFNTHLQYLIKALKTFSQSECDPYLSNLSARLDYNSFYERHFSVDNPLGAK